MDIHITQSPSWYEQLLNPILTSIITTLFGLIAGYLLTKWSEKSKEKERLARIRRIIIQDIKEQKKRTGALIHNYNELEKKLQEPSRSSHYLSIQGLGTKVFDSHHLTDYSEIFAKNSRYLALLEIYGIIEFVLGVLPEKLQDLYKVELEYQQTLTAQRKNSVINSKYLTELEEQSFLQVREGLREKFIGNTSRMKDNVNQLIKSINGFLAVVEKDN